VAVVVTLSARTQLWMKASGFLLLPC